MAHIAYGDDIHRDTNVSGDNVYVDNGCGCNTVWYKSVPACRALLRHLGRVPDGHDLGLCELCSCSYSVVQKGNKAYPEFVCKSYKEGLSKLANEILKRNPSSGKKGDLYPLGESAVNIYKKLRGYK